MFKTTNQLGSIDKPVNLGDPTFKQTHVQLDWGRFTEIFHISWENPWLPINMFPT